MTTSRRWDKKTKKNKKPILKEERRVHRNKNPYEYKKINTLIRRKIRQAKINWLKQECTEIERLQQQHDMFNLHKKLKETAGVYQKKQVSVLVNNEGRIMITPDEKKKTWEDYIRELFSDNEREEAIENHTTSQLTGPAITKDEIRKAIESSKNNKAVGPDNIPVELLKLINDDNIKILEKLFNNIYNTGIFPEDWLTSTFIALPKKANARKCNEHRLISLMSHTLKVFIKIIHNRLYSKCEQSMGKTQFGFKSALGTREALFAIQVLVQNCKDVQKDVFLGFIDYEKAFDRVQHNKLIQILENMDIDEKDIQCIKNLYWHQTAKVKSEDITTADLQINRGVRQGCILSPLLFNIYSEKIFQESIAEENKGIKVNGKFINNIRYADDTTIIADSIEDLQHLMNKINLHSKEFGLNINSKKTKFMIISKNPANHSSSSMFIDNDPIERVNKFKYLGCWLNESWTSEQEIKCRVEMARAAFVKYRKILTNRDININLRLRLTKCYVWSILLYGLESWTLKVTDMNKIEAFEMWTYRRILKISWTSRVTNSEVLNKLGKQRELLLTMKKRKVAYFGHVIRGQKYELLQLIVQGKIEGKRGVGRKQMSWLRNIRNWTNIRTIENLVHTAMDREQYNNVIQSLR